MWLADAPVGLVHPLACPETSSEQTHGLRCGSTNDCGHTALFSI